MFDLIWEKQEMVTINTSGSPHTYDVKRYKLKTFDLKGVWFKKKSLDIQGQEMNAPLAPF